MEITLKIEGLSCGHCVNAVNAILKDTPGVASYEVSLPDTAKVSFDENKVSEATIKKNINDSEIYKII